MIWNANRGTTGLSESSPLLSASLTHFLNHHQKGYCDLSALAPYFLSSAVMFRLNDTKLQVIFGPLDSALSASASFLFARFQAIWHPPKVRQIRSYSNINLLFRFFTLWNFETEMMIYKLRSSISLKQQKWWQKFDAKISQWQAERMRKVVKEKKAE